MKDRKHKRRKGKKRSLHLHQGLNYELPIIYTDGFLVGENPSSTGGGYTLVDQEGKCLARETIRKSGFTNNEAELLAVIKAVERSQQGGQVVTDSQVVQTWIGKGKSKARPDLNEQIQSCNQTVIDKKVAIVFQPREKNLAGVYNDKMRTTN